MDFCQTMVSVRTKSLTLICFNDLYENSHLDSSGRDYPNCPKCNREATSVIFTFGGSESGMFNHSYVEEGFFTILMCPGCKSPALDFHSI